ncbi:MAG: putative nucleic-acid-binding protein [Candidatus Omnitrophota bacterium]|jgi:predicted nucleic-acid-binding protein
MSQPFIDTNIIIRYFTENPQTTKTYQGVFPFFSRLETGELVAELPELVVFEAYYVLTKIYNIDQAEVAQNLAVIIPFKGIVMHNKPIIIATLEFLQTKKTDLVDAYLITASKHSKTKGVYSYDKGFAKQGLKLLPIE